MSSRGSKCGDGVGWPCVPAQPMTLTAPAYPTTTSLLQTLSTQFRLAPEQTADGRPWTYHLVQFADVLLNHSRNVAPLTAFTTQQRQAWDR